MWHECEEESTTELETWMDLIKHYKTKPIKVVRHLCLSAACLSVQQAYHCMRRPLHADVYYLVLVQKDKENKFYDFHRPKLWIITRPHIQFSKKTLIVMRI